MTDAPLHPKTLAEYGDDRTKLNAIKAPITAGFAFQGIDHDYRTYRKVEYLLGMVGHLLTRIEELEAKVAGEGEKGDAS